MIAAMGVCALICFVVTQLSLRMAPAVRAAAETMLREHPGRIDALLDRWIPGRTRYAEA